MSEACPASALTKLAPRNHRPARPGRGSNDYTHVGITATNTTDGVRDFALGGASVRCASFCNGSVVLVSGKTLAPVRFILRVDVEPAPK